MLFSKSRILFVLFFSLLVILVGCKEDEERPADHTLNKGGSFHAPGLYDPNNNCTACHGSTLEGGGEAPSCYSCHGKKW